MYNEKSASGELNKTDWHSIGRGAVVAVAGALATYAIATIPTIDVTQFGKYAPIISAGLAIMVNILRKWVANNK